MSFADALRCQGLFQGLPEEQIREMGADARWREEEVARGTFLLRPGEKINRLLLLIRGTVEGTLLSAEGQLLRVDSYRVAPIVIAPPLLFASAPAFHSIRAREDISLLSMGKDPFLDLLREYPLLLRNFLEISADRFLFLFRKITYLNGPTIRKKLSLYLLDQMREQGRDITLPLNMTALSEYLGVERPSLSTVFHQMKREGLFDWEGKVLTVRNPAVLEREILF